MAWQELASVIDIYPPKFSRLLIAVLRKAGSRDPRSITGERSVLTGFDTFNEKLPLDRISAEFESGDSGGPVYAGVRLLGS